jgi:hypothetical protein
MYNWDYNHCELTYDVWIHGGNDYKLIMMSKT